MGYSRKIIVFVCAIFVGNVIAMEQALNVREAHFVNAISPTLNDRLERIGIVQTQSFSQALPGENPIITFDSIYRYKDDFYFKNLDKKLEVIEIPVLSNVNQKVLRVHYFINLRWIEEMSKGLANIEASDRLKQQREAITQRESKVEEREKKAKDYEGQLYSKKLMIEQDLRYFAQSTFWRRNPHYTFLAGGLLFGVGAYYGHSRIDSLLIGIMKFFSGNKDS